MWGDIMNKLLETYEKIMEATVKNAEFALPALLTAIDYCRSELGMSVEDIAQLMHDVESQLGPVC